MAKSIKKPAETAKKDGDPHYIHASATLLGEQAASIDTTKEDTALPHWLERREWNVIRGLCDARLAQLRAWRTSWWMQNWSDLSEFIEPRRSIWLTQSAGGLPTPNNMTRGLEINSSIVDPTATFAARVCTGGMVSGLVSQSRPWFKMVPGLPNIQLDDAARQWFDTTEARIYKILSLSNFYSSSSIKIGDAVVFGTAPRIIYEDAKTVINCYNPCCGEYYVWNDGTGRTGGFARQFVMTILQMVDFFGIDKCPPDIQKLWEEKGSGLDQERIVNHIIEPNYGLQPPGTLGGRPVGIVPGNYAWREIYYVMGASEGGPLSYTGYIENPVSVTRWSTQSNDAYGRSPGMDVLPDVLQLQVETQRKAEAIEKQVRPPLVASMDMKNQPSSSIPGSVTYVAKLGADTGMKPMYEIEPNIAAMSADIAAIQARIKTGLFNDLFGMFLDMPTKEMTAYETAQRVNERLQIIGPVIENMLGDLRDELKRVYGIMERRNLIDPKPDSLKNVPIHIDFVSMLALAAKAAATGGIERLAGFIGNLVAVFPEAKDNFDVDEAINTMAEMLGTPLKILRDKKTIDSMRQAQQQQASQQQKMANAQHVAQTANIGAQAAQTLAGTQVGAGQSALNVLGGYKA